MTDPPPPPPRRRELDPIALAEQAQQDLADFLEEGECEEPGCDQHAAPTGPAYVFGRDQDGLLVYMRKWRCVAGHWYHVEVGT